MAGIREQLLTRNDWEAVASAQRKELSAANARLSINQTRMKALVDAFEQCCAQSEKEEALVRQTHPLQLLMLPVLCLRRHRGMTICHILRGAS